MFFSDCESRTSKETTTLAEGQDFVETHNVEGVTSRDGQASGLSAGKEGQDSLEKQVNAEVAGDVNLESTDSLVGSTSSSTGNIGGGGCGYG